MRRANGDASRLGAVGLTLLATALLAGRLAAGAILALTPGFVRFGSTLLLDTALALGALAGLLATARAFARGGSGLWWAGVWFGVAFLGKGALALGAPAVLATYWLATP